MSVPSSSDPNANRWTFGEPPLDEGVAFASAIRDLVSTALALEFPSQELRALTEVLRSAQRQLGTEAAADYSPRIGPTATTDQRVYVDHSRDIGDFNPCFPRYALRCRDDRGDGEVEFPLLYEGPPGLVHGGFLAVFFDCVLQQLNCDLGLTGKTAELTIRYRRPTPLLTRLDVHARREIVGDRIHSSAELELDGKVLCEAEMRSAVGDRAALPVVSPRRRP
jgi:acyl-coenzyme A thioesterase PaaI-like protein